MAPELGTKGAEGEETVRIVGWRSGQPLTSKDVHDILRNERRARHDYKAVRKVASASKAGGGKSGGTANQHGDPLAGLPPTWQAFYSSMPHLDPQAAFKAFRKEQIKQTKEKTAGGAAPQTLTAEEETRLDAEIQKLEDDIKRKRSEYLEKEKLNNEWENRLKRLRSLDVEELEVQKRMVRRLEKASYEYGIMEGKLRSSDIYHKFLLDDEKVQHHKKVTSLSRSCALMGKQIDMLKGDVRSLLKAAAEEKVTSDKPKSSDASASGVGSQKS